MRRTFVIVLFSLLAIGVFSQELPKRPKIGLVFSGGGAKGFADVGVLKVLEEAGIPIDYITGTSIGSIVGGLYAIGYDAKTLESIVSKQDWAGLLSNSVKREFIPTVLKEEQTRYLLSLPIETNKINIPLGVLNGQNVMELFTYLTYGYHDVPDFSKLPIPFKCIATDISSGEEVVLDHGFLPKAMRASMAVPAVFSASEIDGRKLVDGGLVNNFPVDRCREMGADIIIGVDIQDGLLSKEKIKSIPDVIAQLTTLMAIERSNKNKNSVDILIKPDLTGYTGASFDTESANVLMKRGEYAAQMVLPQLIRLRDSLGLVAPVRNHRALPDEDSSIFIDNIIVDGTSKSNILLFFAKLGVAPGENVTLNYVRQCISKIYATGNYDYVDYQICGDQKKTLIISTKEGATNWLNVGLHYDTDLKAGALINTTLYTDRVSGSNLSLDAKLATFPMFSIRYSMDRGWRPGLSSSLSFITDEIWGYENSSKVSEISVQLTNFQLGSQAVVFDDYRVSAGMSAEHFSFGSILGTGDYTNLKDATFFNYFAKISLDKFDKPHFPSKGWAMDGIFKLITDNGIKYDNSTPVSVVGLNVKGVHQISRRIAFLPSFYSQFALASDVPVYYRSYIGGLQKTNYFGVYVPFVGLRRMEISADKAAIARLDVRLRMWEKIYVSLNTNIGLFDGQQSHEGGDHFMIGGGLSVAYNSAVGPIELNFSTSNWNNNITPFFSLGYFF